MSVELTTTQTIKDFYYYSNGSYELKQLTFIPKDGVVAKVEKVSRKITGPIPREDLARFVEHIDLNSSNWQQEMKEALEIEQFTVVAINADGQSPQELGMTRSAYLQSYITWTTAAAATALTATFFAPGIIAAYFPATAPLLGLVPIKESQNIAAYSASAWTSGFFTLGGAAQKLGSAVPCYIATPVLSYIGYKGLEEVVKKVIEFPAVDYKTWTALNLRKYLEQVYPKIIPETYRKDPVLKKYTYEGFPIRSPFVIAHASELGMVYEEHVLKNILSNQMKLTGKLVCPQNESEKIAMDDVKRDQELSDRIELRLLLLDAHAFKKVREPTQPTDINSQD